MEKTFDKTTKKFNSRMQARLLLVFCVVAALLFGLMGRLVYIVQVDGDRYTKQVLSRQTYVSSVLPYKRGDILDCNQSVLARSELQYKLILDPKLLLENDEYIKTTITALNKNFGIKEANINTILQEKPDSHYVVVTKNLKYDLVHAYQTDKTKSKDVVGVTFEEQYVRNYPFKTLACDVIGFSNSENAGFYGIEEYYNAELNGTNGREYGYYDSNLDIDRIVKPAVNGNSIVTTINADVQRIIQEKIVEFNQEYGSKEFNVGEVGKGLGVGILVMNPNNGDIIAMASNKEYDLNSPRSLEGFYTDAEIKAMSEEEKTKILNALWKNDEIGYTFEPGSTFKPITVAAALEENLVSDNSTFVCDGGEMKDGKHIACAHVHGDITLGGSLAYSCNDVMMQLAVLEGKNLFRKYMDHFGIGQKTGIDLPGEEAGMILSLENMGESGLATSSFGQSTSSTMIQIAAAFSSAINGGNYYQPHVMKKIINDNGATIKEYNKVLVRKTVSEQTSELLRNYLYQAVEVGTATGAKVDGYSIGGKTGTAQKLPRGTNARVVSFIGFSPVVNPQMVIYVVLDEPQGFEKQTSGIATAFSGEILNAILPVLGIYPDGDIDYLIPTVTPLPTPGGRTTEGTTPEGTTPEENSTPAEDTNADSQDTEETTEEASDTNAATNTSTNTHTPGEEGASMADQLDFGDE